MALLSWHIPVLLWGGYDWISGITYDGINDMTCDGISGKSFS